jgi:hypothetical protein
MFTALLLAALKILLSLLSHELHHINWQPIFILEALRFVRVKPDNSVQGTPTICIPEALLS